MPKKQPESQHDRPKDERRETYELHNDESAYNWPSERQCQCDVCEEYRKHNYE